MREVRHVTLTKHDYDLFVKDESTEFVVLNRIASQVMFGDVAAFVDEGTWVGFLHQDRQPGCILSVRTQIANTARSIVRLQEHPTILSKIKEMYTPHLKDEIKEIQIRRVYLEEQLRQVEEAYKLTSVLLNDFLMEFGYAHDDKQMALSKVLNMLHSDEMEDVVVYKY